MRRTTPALSAILAVVATACSQEPSPAEAPVEPVAAAPTPGGTPVSYTCESGQTVVASYPDTSSARIRWRGQDHVLQSAQAASGARYVGDELEWWTATRNGVESGTLSRIEPGASESSATLERCSRPLPAAPTPTPAAAQVQSAPGGVLPAAVPCRGDQLRLSSEGGDAGAGNRVSNVGVQNVGAAACSLTGYPGVVLQDRQGRNLTAIRSEQSPGSYFIQGQAPTPVTLEPQAKAAFEIAWSVVPNEGIGERVCPSVTRIGVTVPGDTTALPLDIAFTPCGGRVRVSPLRPFTGAPMPAPEPTA